MADEVADAVADLRFGYLDQVGDEVDDLVIEVDDPVIDVAAGVDDCATDVSDAVADDPRPAAQATRAKKIRPKRASMSGMTILHPVDQ